MFMPFEVALDAYKGTLNIVTLVSQCLPSFPDPTAISCSISTRNMLWSLLTGSLAVTSICAQSVEDYIATQRPIAKTKLLANIGESAGGNPGIVIASPSTDDPDYYFTWTRDSSLVFQAIIDQLSIPNWNSLR